MIVSKPQSRLIFAPAKINLFLHITGKLEKEYHSLDSLVVFADIGDEIIIDMAPSFSFEVRGPFAEYFSKKERGSTLDNPNLVVRAARALSQITNKQLNLKITLIKNLPLASGLGGGSSDAAATLWGLMDFWDIPHDERYIFPMMEKLGADIPVCLKCRPSVIRGFGNIIDEAPTMPEIPVVLVNPLVNCPTKDVFLNRSGSFKNESALPRKFSSVHTLVKTLSSLGNDLTVSATKHVPEISNILTAIEMENGCLLARMTGSGATCFGLFESLEKAEKAASSIQLENPDWWVKSGWLNRIERY